LIQSGVPAESSTSFLIKNPDVFLMQVLSVFRRYGQLSAQ
jgi:hypothetical protein